MNFKRSGVFWRPLTVCAVSLSTALAGISLSADDYNVAVMHGVWENQYGKNIHNDEYDYALKTLKWKNKKYASTVADMQRLSNELDQYDAVLMAPLFNYSKDVIDMKPYGKKFRKFIENGGALIITDAHYMELLGWLTEIDPSMKLGRADCHASRDITNTEPVDHVRFVPNAVREINTWAHFDLPPQHGWKVVAKCGDGSPFALMKRIGKGYVFVGIQRYQGVQEQENWRAALELQRIGLRVGRFEMPQLQIGANTLTIALNADRKTSLKCVLTVTPADAPEKKTLFSKELTLAPQKNTVVTLPYEITSRGKVNVSFSVSDGKNTAGIFNKNVEIPELLTLKGTRYRGFAVESELKKTGRIIATVDIAPYKEDLKKLTLTTKVTDQSGKQIGEVSTVPADKTYFKLPLQIGVPAPGEYTIASDLMEGDKVLQSKTAKLTVLSDKNCPTYVNDDMNLVVDGEEFFPIGIYHIQPSEIPAAAAIGFNMVQMFSWFGDAGATVPARYGMKVLWEQNHRHSCADWLGPEAVNLVKRNPNIFMWYGMDEPTELARETAKKITDIYHKFDQGRPTFVVSYTTNLFPSQVELGDIFAIDPYPYPNSDIATVSEWMDKAWAATKGDKPVLCVPQSFGTEPPNILRAMLYQAIVHEARGIIWYPWDDGNNTGLKYNKPLQKTMSEMVFELKYLSKALLNKTGRKQFSSENGKIHGLYCQESPDKKFVLLVNPQKNSYLLDLTKLDGLQGYPVMKEVFGDGRVKTSNSNFVVKGFESKVYVLLKSETDDFPAQKMPPRKEIIPLEGDTPLLSASSEDDPAGNAMDGLNGTRWTTKESNGAWLRIDLGRAKTFNQINLYWDAAYGKEYQIEISDDFNKWTPIFSRKDGKGGTETIALNTAVTARFVRLSGIKSGNGNGCSIKEIDFVKEEPAPPSNGKITTRASDPIQPAYRAVDGDKHSRWESRCTDNQ